MEGEEGGRGGLTYYGKSGKWHNWKENIGGGAEGGREGEIL